MSDKLTTAELQQMVVDLRRELDELKGTRPSRQAEEVYRDGPEPGSDGHAYLLGLRKATDADGELQLDGWALEDITSYHPSTPKEYFMRLLQQKVNSLKSPKPKIQSMDPHKPGFAPTMWVPDGTPFRKITRD